MSRGLRRPRSLSFSSLWFDTVSPFVVMFVDNNGVKEALVSCGTASVNASAILKARFDFVR